MFFGLGVQGLKAYVQAVLPVYQMLCAAMKKAMFFLVESLWRILFIVYKPLVLLVVHAVQKCGNPVSPSSTDAGVHYWQILHTDIAPTELRPWVSF